MKEDQVKLNCITLDFLNDLEDDEDEEDENPYQSERPAPVNETTD